MRILNQKENVGRILATKKDVLKAYREVARARSYAESYPKNELGKIRLAKAEAVFMGVLSKNLGREISRDAAARAEIAMDSFFTIRKKGMKIARDKVLWELLDRVENERNFADYYALDSRLSRYGFMSYNRLERFLQEVNVRVLA